MPTWWFIKIRLETRQWIHDFTGFAFSRFKWLMNFVNTLFLSLWCVNTAKHSSEDQPKSPTFYQIIISLTDFKLKTYSQQDECLVRKFGAIIFFLFDLNICMTSQQLFLQRGFLISFQLCTNIWTAVWEHVNTVWHKSFSVTKGLKTVPGFMNWGNRCISVCFP